MSEEKVLGGLEVETQLQFGQEHLLFLYTDQRLLFSHLAKIGAKGLALSRIFGGIADGLGRVSAKRGELQRISTLTPDEILKLHRDNFGFTFDQVVSLALEPESYGRVSMVLVTSDMKVDMTASLTAARNVAPGLQDVLKEKFRSRI